MKLAKLEIIEKLFSDYEDFYTNYTIFNLIY